MRPLLFHRLLRTLFVRHDIPLSLRRRVLDDCSFRLFAASMAFAIVEKLGSLFFPLPG